jgi:hypothetical protein
VSPGAAVDPGLPMTYVGITWILPVAAWAPQSASGMTVCVCRVPPDLGGIQSTAWTSDGR